VMGYAFNQQIPGPRIRITQGDRVRFHVTNYLPEATTVHWHGLILPNEMDGPAYITQDPSNRATHTATSSPRSKRARSFTIRTTNLTANRDWGCMGR
jgi:FtsP/CotA-like multicopper oxidase with cupredoxin domain